jgi:phosphonate transport system permease protein
MSAAAASAKRVPFPTNWTARILWIALAVYTVYAASILDISFERFVRGIDQGGRFLGRMFPPNFAADKMVLLQQGMIESLQIAILATFFGVILSLPLGLFAARNLMPAPVAWTARGVIALCRSFHPVIVAILFVKAVGFGALAGVLALIVASMGFISKLFAEAIEEMSLKQVEGVRATGASFMNVLMMGVLPQVMARFIGFGAYQLDSNLRNSTMVGIVGGGGIGATLFTAYQRFDYDFVLTILLAIIAVIMVGEVLSGWLRKIFQ